ncbi:MAG: class I SAM-dependent methyltransferase [Chloroflexi bacterium]|nr:class I SAM-dependent methyltransferase [Chloroflexota bacterium]
MTTTQATAVITLHPKATKNTERRHPWLFSGAVRSVDGKPADGDIVRIHLHDGQPVGLGYFNNQSNIRVRVLTWDINETIDDGWWANRLQASIARRTPLPNAARLVNAENDYLPGLIVDKYDGWLVLQSLSMGIETRKTMLAGLLAELLDVRGMYERSDIEIRSKEGLPADTMGVLWGEAPPETITIEENGHQLLVDVYTGHKTGFYLDQRENRLQLREWLKLLPASDEMTVLNTFSFTGGFTVAALAGGVKRAISIDSSAEAIDLARANVEMNGFAVNEEDFIQANVFDVLRDYRDEGQQFDLIILDPPKFARHAKQVQSASRGYKDINWLAFRLLKPGGYLWTFSCSNAVDMDLFQKIVFGAIIDAEREGQIVGRLQAASDHPVALTFPEGAYLKGLVCRVV